MQNRLLDALLLIPSGLLTTLVYLYLNAGKPTKQVCHIILVNCNVMPFCLPANDYIEFICIIAGTLLIFPARGCAPDIRPRVCTGKYCP